MISSAPLAPPRGDWMRLPLPLPTLPLRSREGERLEVGVVTLGREDAASAWLVGGGESKGWVESKGERAREIGGGGGYAVRCYG